MAKRKNLFLFTCSNQVTHQRTGDTSQRIDDNGKQGGNTSYNVRYSQFRFSQTFDRHEEQKPNGYTCKELEHTPYRDRKYLFQYRYINTPV